MANCSQESDFTKLPARRKNVKPDVQRKLLKRALVDVLNVSPICVLHSLVEKESFRFESIYCDGCHHKAILYIDGQIFEALSSQKKPARDLVVNKALQHLFPDIVRELQEDSSATLINITPSVKIDPTMIFAGGTLSKLHIQQDQNCTSAKKIKTEDCSKITNGKLNGIANQFPMENGIHFTAKSITSLNVPFLKPGLKSKTIEQLVTRALGIFDSSNPNTVTALHSLFDKEAFHFDVKTIGNNMQMEYEATLSIGEKIYRAVGKSIKKSKNNVTIVALRDLFPEIATVPKTFSDHTSINGIEANNQIKVIKMPKDWAEKKFPDFIANLVQNKYKEVVSAEPQHLQKCSVLAGIVMIQNENFNSGTVICVSTGNKCIQGDLVSTRGDVLFDCHAEILSKRCLISFLYDQISKFLSDEPNTIVEKSINGRFRVKENVKFYLYISSAPCGDGRVFTFSQPKNPFSKKLIVKRGLLRVKPESGMGGIPVTEYSTIFPTFEDYLQGRPFVLMCCSAKLLRCNLLGTQGALLSHFLEPVYFDGILIGDIFHKENVTRALYERLPMTNDEIPAPYRLNKPFVEGITDGKICLNVKPSKSSMNWLVHDAKTEFLCTRTGKTIDGNLSRLCKLNMFVNFKNILNMCDGILYSKHNSSVSYKTYKLNSSPYQELKHAFFKSLEDNGRGKWISKTEEFDEFYYDAESCSTNENVSIPSPSHINAKMMEPS